MVIAAVLGAAVLVGGSLGSINRPQQTVGVTESNVEPVEANIDVHVAGWVLSPGVVRVASGSIVADAIEAAGGLRAGALVDRINLAAPLRSGDQIVVLGPARWPIHPKTGPLLSTGHRRAISRDSPAWDRFSPSGLLPTANRTVLSKR